AGRNEPLKKERPKWKSDYPMTDGQLRSKRDEASDTVSPAKVGRQGRLCPFAWGGPFPIWVVRGDAYAQHLVLLSPGSLTECYDELGNRYQLPVYCLAPPVNLILERSEEEAVRLSTGKDLRLSASMGDTIGQLKKQLQAQEGIDLAWQRWFFSGKLLTDRTRLQETKIQKDFVVQVIVNQPLPPRN
ncbi:Ubiquitin domain-containing protein 1, partial [Colius striatus]